MSDHLRLLRHQASPMRLSGPIIEAVLPGVKIGEVCDIRRDWTSREVIARAQVLGFNQERTLLSLIGPNQGLSRDVVLHPTGGSLTIKVSEDLLGTVIDPAGQITERLVEPKLSMQPQVRPIDSDAPEYSQRSGIDQPLVTGIRTVDSVLTCGTGQRVGIFASAGCGKTVLMHMLIDRADADVFVIGLIGERGREVTEFAEQLRRSDRRGQCILVYATSDYSSLDRCNAAMVATTIAEYFRDQGKRVVLFVDSLTRYARALRDVALAQGQVPARRGYPASVFDAMPRLLERPGNTRLGSITAFYTVLLESDDEADPIADEIRSILDGHIYLSRKLAAQNHYPAIDVLRSISRVAGQITDEQHQSMAGEIRRLLAKLEELQIFLDLGEYKSGENAENDRAINKRQALENFLRQGVHEPTDIQSTLQAMYDIAH
ncbi:type III secretion system ATPase SctN [Acerihabitans sp. TG2]|uniref:type III secretion system ATPase SctN n=1 Tax=Acerihabitans sp. TG2 TaxID=3096008 RepID=UPI002B2339FE|nr:type III secretion system ATPase SctN [Acerihabitans sp. TG2]MEA9389625.1 type III secretion system ATPase SctN [Acerihabitans sp. TG2]